VPELAEWTVALAGSAWLFLALYVVVTVDGFFPPVPSESAVIALAALAASGGEPNLWALGVVAAAGAFTGDLLAYTIGRRIAGRGPRILRSRRANRAVTWAETALAHRGAALIIGARFLPVGRVAVNMTAGAVAFPRRRFTALAAVAAVIWAAYSIALGVGAGHLLEGHHPLAGVAVGVVGGLVTGALVDRVLRRLLPVRPQRARAARPRSPHVPVAGPR